MHAYVPAFIQLELNFVNDFCKLLDFEFQHLRERERKGDKFKLIKTKNWLKQTW